MDYEPLLAKLVGFGENREQTIARLACALNEYFVGGIKTNLSLFRRILHNPDFHSAKLDTGFLDRMLMQKVDVVDDNNAPKVAAIAAGIFSALDATPGGGSERSATNGYGRSAAKPTNWKNTSRSEALR